MNALAFVLLARIVSPRFTQSLVHKRSVVVVVIIIYYLLLFWQTVHGISYLTQVLLLALAEKSFL